MASETFLRENLAACTRILSMQGLLGLFGHVSTYQPETGRIYISPGKGSNKSTMSAGELAVMDLDGKVLEGEGQVPREWPIHTALHRARPDALAVAHIHSPYATLFAIAKREYRPVTLQAAMFEKGIPLYTQPHLITTPALGVEIAELIGNKRAALLQGHGTVIVGANVEEMLYATLVLEDDTRKAVQASVLGELQVFSEQECREFESVESLQRRAQRSWNYFVMVESCWDRQPTTGINIFV